MFLHKKCTMQYPKVVVEYNVKASWNVNSPRYYHLNVGPESRIRWGFPFHKILYLHNVNIPLQPPRVTLICMHLGKYIKWQPINIWRWKMYVELITEIFFRQTGLDQHNLTMLCYNTILSGYWCLRKWKSKGNTNN